MIKYTGILVLYVALILIVVFGAAYIVSCIVRAIGDTIRERETNGEEEREGKGKETANH